ncbi:sugar-binding protein [Altibacter sp. HG106]|uniref:sugar-binding protein n=1 Tax=Altibacter sp. HG106 TaxID=3023937 RepID=UPI0023500C53|nr:sugar-binding protein [Altibacter sp. HG106]MDC7994810.1 sugar-binding protein [Altibacter sp. HG106]
MKSFIIFSTFLMLVGCKQTSSSEEKITANTTKAQQTESKKEHQLREVLKTNNPPIINGNISDAIWKTTKWHPLDQRWVGEPYTEEDFSGRYKMAWDKEALYLLVMIEDDTLIDIYKDPLVQWWDDDCVEVFIDEDNSGGPHQFTHNAFAYHVALDGNVVDLGPDEAPHLYNDHVMSKHTTEGTTSIWELKIKVFDDSFVDGKKGNTPVTLSAGKKIGFVLAYCDNDHSETRENFIGSVYVPGEDKNQGWINADIFGTILLTE